MKNYSVSDEQYNIPVEEPKTRRSLNAPTSVFAPEISQAFADAREAAAQNATKKVTVNGAVVSVPTPFPSPPDWRDCWMYFLILDRFANDQFSPTGAWNQRYDFRQGGTFRGVIAHLDDVRDLVISEN